jgi:hypothetical protein
MAPGSAPRVNIADGIVKTPVAKMTVGILDQQICR